MSAAYRVVFPYVTLLVKDGNGSKITLGYYQGALIENPVEGDHLDMLVDSGYIEKAQAAAAEVEKQPVVEKSKASTKSGS